MKPERVRVAVVGTGGIGRFHIRLWQELPTAEVVGVFDPDAKAAREAAERYGVKRIYGALAEAVGDPKVDLVDICSPNLFHREGVVAALEAGKHCLCEKPLAVTPAEIEAMIAARDRSGKLLMTAQHLRFEQRSQALKRLIDAGRLGDVYYTRACWLRRRFAPVTPGFLRRQQAGRGWPSRCMTRSNRCTPRSRLGHPRPVSVTGVTARHLAQRPDVANEWGAFQAADFEVEEFAAGFIRLENGAALSLEVSWLLNMLEKEHYGVWLYGTEGGAQWPELKLSSVQDGLLVDTTIVSQTGGDGHKNELAACADAVLHGKPSPVPAEQSLTVARILAALYESAETGREVRL